MTYKIFIKLIVPILILFFSCKNYDYTLCENLKKDYNFHITRIFKNFNEDNNEKTYDLFSREFQDKISKNEIVAFLNQLNYKYGKFNSFKKVYENKRGIVYDIYFEKSVRQLLIKTENKECKIETFLIKKSIRPKVSLSKLSLPFDSVWYTHWGGNTYENNYHIKSIQQQGAFDFSIKNNKGKTYKNKGFNNSDYFSWGRNILSPCDGVIIETVDGIKDNNPREINNNSPKGNYILMKCKKIDNEFILMSHFMKGSLRVKKGDKVLRKELIAKCGNSGRTTEPHLHFHIQNTTVDSTSIGLIAKFDSIYLNRKEKITKNYTPLKGDFVENKD
ncbi:peptidoglycan DD-metalloendopeptidase family protein [Polaribacter sp. MSW13]|uniref:Peptidoglycan DD-metalloendopeptidase family protein n=1 Tax=Polaribacter marinus TaxID=2916838 RepID=A0A9X2AM40_9FLAO|nr:M23 family metallopeptidase [Polaribacter marinus]MCI2229950.1 peptidoglycan DD-metalloendopeptidase family protein [Polaribacter marinus]